MIPYRYDAPQARHIFDDEAKIQRWMTFTKAYALAKAPHLHQEIEALRSPTSEAVATREQETHHDVVAFLQLVSESCPDEVLPHLHYGLTSSDLVDNAHFAALREHAEGLTLDIDRLREILRGHINQRLPMVRAGRTHGQVAALTTWSHQIEVTYSVLNNIENELDRYIDDRIIKSPGPTGYSPGLIGTETWIADHFGAGIVPSTQIIPRDYQVAWATLYLRLAGVLENLALLVRTSSRSDVAEVKEGVERSGSSAMPHKHNPIDSEKICGLSRVARGYFMTLSEGVAFWEDRDLTNSSMERIAVPGLAATVEHMTRATADLMENLQVNHIRMRDNARRDTRTASNILQTLAQKHFGLGPIEASDLVKTYVSFMGTDYYVSWGKLNDKFGYSTDAVQAWVDEANQVWHAWFKY